MKQLIAAGALAALTALSAPVAAQSFDPAKVKGNIVFYTHFGNLVESGQFKRWADAFNEVYPEATVEVITVANYRREMGTRIATGEYGDVLNILDSLPPSDYHKFYQPMNGAVFEDNYYFVDRYTVDGDVYGYVYGVVAEGTVYNKRAFEKAGIDGVPKTKTELFEACEKLKAVGVTPIHLNMGAGWPMQQWEKVPMMFADNGGYYEDMLKDQEPFTADSPFGKSMNFLNELFHSGCTEKDYTADNWANSKAFLGIGDVGMFFLGNWSVPQAIESAAALGYDASNDLGMFPLPIDDSGQNRLLISPDWALGVSKYSKNPDTAKAWIEFLFDKTDVASTAGFIPGKKDVESDLAVIKELYSYEPELITVKTPSSDFKQAMADARFDFQYGAYIRDVILSSDFDAAITDLNARWARATGQ